MRFPSGVMGKPNDLFDFIKVEYRDINLYLKKDIIRSIKDNKLELLLEGYGKYIIEFQN